MIVIGVDSNLTMRARGPFATATVAHRRDPRLLGRLEAIAQRGLATADQDWRVRAELDNAGRVSVRLLDDGHGQRFADLTAVIAFRDERVFGRSAWRDHRAALR